MKISRAIYLLLFISLCSFVQEDVLFKNDKTASTMTVNGTSTLHDWTADVTNFDISVLTHGNGILDIDLTALSGSLKSGHSGMDDNMYKALKTTEFPKITFSAKKVVRQGVNLNGIGNLTIAGVTKPIKLTSSYEQWNDNSYKVKGSISFKMSEFGITPPTAMMGTIKTGDKITIKFEVSMLKQ